MKSCWRVKGIILLCIASSEGVTFCCEADAQKRPGKISRSWFCQVFKVLAVVFDCAESKQLRHLIQSLLFENILS